MTSSTSRTRSDQYRGSRRRELDPARSRCREELRDSFSIVLDLCCRHGGERDRGGESETLKEKDRGDEIETAKEKETAEEKVTAEESRDLQRDITIAVKLADVVEWRLRERESLMEERESGDIGIVHFTDSSFQF
ncbi:hypothetical protein L484_008729 [Morus notabilis]|uniref:Uncharacterized protein n=1 Tax=Morus notabilis TaxID=981085 RepID=W9R8T5_9ROSA|nr:hypothetical protein L484_008729 [Morus notabilis]